MDLQKAKIYVYRKNKETQEIYVQFNPAEYSVNESSKHKEKDNPSGQEPSSQFIAKGVAELQVTLHFDTYTKDVTADDMDNIAAGKWGKMKEVFKREDVRAKMRNITELMVVDPKTLAPPKVMFAWGSLSFFGTVTTINQKFTMFLSDGKPVRAQIDLTIESEPDEEKVSTPTPLPDALDLPATIKNGDDWKNAMIDKYLGKTPRELLENQK